MVSPIIGWTSSWLTVYLRRSRPTTTAAAAARDATTTGSARESERERERERENTKPQRRQRDRRGGRRWRLVDARRRDADDLAGRTWWASSRARRQARRDGDSHGREADDLAVGRQARQPMEEAVQVVLLHLRRRRRGEARRDDGNSARRGGGWVIQRRTPAATRSDWQQRVSCEQRKGREVDGFVRSGAVDRRRTKGRAASFIRSFVGLTSGSRLVL